MEILVMLAGVIYIGLLGSRVMGKIDEFVEQGDFAERENEQLIRQEKRESVMPEDNGMCETEFTLYECWGCK